MKFTNVDALDLQGLEYFIEGTKSNVSTAVNVASGAFRAHQLMGEINDALKYKGADLGLADAALSRMEDIIALVAGLSTSTCMVNFLSILHLYVRTHYKGSTAKYVWDLVISQFTFLDADISFLWKDDREVLDFQSAVEGVDDGKNFWESHETEFNQLKQGLTDWKGVFKGQLMNNFANVVNILITLGFMPQSDDQTFKCGNFTLFRTKCWDMQKDSSNFAEMCADTTLFFLERAYSALRYGDASLLLYSDKQTSDMDKEYALLVACAPLLDAGRIEDLGDEFLDDADFGLRLEDLIAKFAAAIKAEKLPQGRTVMTNRLVVLQKLRVSLIMAQKRSPMREKPYGIAIFGGSGVGKSTINASITKFLLHANNLPNKKENIITLNDSDKFQSEYRSHHTAVCLDDHGNTKAEHYDVPPTVRIIDFLNNVQKAALNPNVELKGNIMYRMKLVTLTTNVKDLLAHQFSNEPVSVLRRFNCFMTAELRPHAVDPDDGGLNHKAVTHMFADCWSIKLERVKIVRTEGLKADGYVYETIMEDATIMQVCEWLRTDSAEHYEKQKKIVEDTLELYDRELCEHSFLPEHCPHCLKAENKLDTQAAEEWCDACEPFDRDNVKDVISQEIKDTVVKEPSVQEAVKAWYEGIDYAEAGKTTFKTVSEFFESHKKEALVAACAAIGIPLAAITILKVLRPCIGLLHNQGCEESAPVKVDTDHDNPWKKVKPVNIPTAKAGETMTHNQLIGLVKRGLAHVSFQAVGTNLRRRCCAVAMGNNHWLVPAHIVDGHDEYDVTFQLTEKGTLGNNFSSRIDKSRWVYLLGDYALLSVPNGVPNIDLSRFLVYETDYELSCTMYASIVHRDVHGVSKVYDVATLEKGAFSTKYCTFEGMSYNFPVETNPGLCMAPMIPKLSQARILGFHLAGRNGDRYGVSGVLSRYDVQKAKKELSLLCPAFVTHNATELPSQKYGIDMSPTAAIHPKHAINYLRDEDGQQPVCETMGAHAKGGAKFVSQVRKSPISDSVTKHLGLEKIHGKPSNGPLWKHWNRDLTLMTHPSGKFSPRILDRAFKDLKRHYLGVLFRHPELLDLIHPYPKEYVLGGLDGVASLDRVDLNTSMGWPINKKKRDFISPLVDIKIPGITEPIDFDDPQYWDEVVRMEDCLAMGERVHVVHRGNLKDEPTKYTKDKIRVFAGSEFAFTCLMRKYYLSIFRVMQMHWQEFECAVGINAHGPQWGELVEYLTQFGDERMIAGDYKAFDKSMTPEITMLIFDIYISMAAHAGYTERQRKIMRGIATEICYPLYEYDGVYVQVAGSNPSGHGGTVQVNNGANSLYQRYAYYSLHDGEEVPPYAERVIAANYGDDNTMNVHPDEDKFNHTTMAQELSKVGVTYTMADKSSKSVPFQPLKDISFLKRGFRFDEELGMWVGPLEEDSIAKSLHNYMNRKGSQTLPDEIAAQAIKNASREYFYHGRSKFEERRTQLLHVVDECNLRGYIQDLPTFEEVKETLTGVKPPIVRYDDTLLDLQMFEEIAGDVHRAFAKETLAQYRTKASCELLEEDLMKCVISDFGCAPFIKEQPFGSTALGVPDLVFETGHLRLMVLVETKVVSGRTQNVSRRARLAREQAKRYTRTLAALKPKSVILGFIFTETGYEHICSYNTDELTLRYYREFLSPVRHLLFK